jgi:HSP90 family molecular chaperone
MFRRSRTAIIILHGCDARPVGARNFSSDRFIGLRDGGRARAARQPAAQAEGTGQNALESKLILEINPNHPLVTRFKCKDASGAKFMAW